MKLEKTYRGQINGKRVEIDVRISDQGVRLDLYHPPNDKIMRQEFGIKLQPEFADQETNIALARTFLETLGFLVKPNLKGKTMPTYDDWKLDNGENPAYEKKCDDADDALMVLAVNDDLELGIQDFTDDNKVELAIFIDTTIEVDAGDRPLSTEDFREAVVSYLTKIIEEVKNA